MSDSIGRRGNESTWRGLVRDADQDLLDYFAEIVDEIHAAPGLAEIEMIGVGDLESLFHQDLEEVLWPAIEWLARQDPLFRHALAQAWAYGSPMYAQREALLAELNAKEQEA